MENNEYVWRTAGDSRVRDTHRWGPPIDPEDHPAVVLAAELDAGRVEPQEFTIPVISPELMRKFQREWRRRPKLRRLIAHAGTLEEATVSVSQTARALWEMARSREWRRDQFVAVCADFPEFTELADDPTSVEQVLRDWQ